jgi:hypothetical protein
MDFISVPEATENLTERQIREVNRLRRRLLQGDRSGQFDTNRRVKIAMAVALDKAAVRSVIEWGCGYHPLQPFLHQLDEFVGVDLDPEVVEEGTRTSAGRCIHTDEVATRLAGSRFDAIVSVFVFHFKLPVRHIEQMIELIGEDGFIFANVYRRSPESRYKLLSAFEERGLQVTYCADPTSAVSEHEFWFIAKPEKAATTGRTVLDAVAAAMNPDAAEK